MKFYKAAILTAFLFLFQSNANAAGGPFGLGIILGEPTGISGKYWLNSTNAIDGAIGWDVGRRGDMHLHADYLFHFFDVIPIPAGRLPLYFGPGITFVLRNDPLVGIRIPCGLSYMFDNVPIDVFLEIVPGMALIPSTDFLLNAGLGLRFYF